MGLISVFLPLLLVLGSARGSLREEVKARAGEEVLLPCAVRRSQCGDFHSIKWYKENRRVFVYSPLADFAKAEGELLDRAQLMLDEGSDEARLRLSEVRPADEGEYKCEITFLDITKECPVVQLVRLTTLAEPKYLNITLPDGQDVHQSSASSDDPIGPFNEGQELRLLCESGGGKPIPRVNWYNGSDIISGKASSFEESDGTGTGRNEIRLRLGRGDLLSPITCQAENEAIADNPMTETVYIDVNLRPLKTEIVLAGAADEDSTVGAVEEGSQVTLLCRATGARPPARITWYNGTLPLKKLEDDVTAIQKPPVDVTVKKSDETYETQSRVSFVASRFENGESITCEAENGVTEAMAEEPIRDAIALQVLYAPVVTVSPLNQTVNASEEFAIYCTYESNPDIITSVKWFRDGLPLDVGNESKYEGGEPDRPSLFVASAGPEDAGEYTCVVDNEVGRGVAANASNVEILFPPSVVLRMDPPSPVSESDRVNVSLFCDVVDGNPPVLDSVKWFMDGVLLKQLPLCDQDDDQQLCDLDPSMLFLEHVSRSFHANYSCQGSNDAGWSEESEEQELKIYYPPGRAFIRQESERVVKGDAITLNCEIYPDSDYSDEEDNGSVLEEDLGRPEAVEFVWTRGGHVVNDVRTNNWTIDPVTVEAEANISCYAVNAVGRGGEDFIQIDVLAPPSFIEPSPPYFGSVAQPEDPDFAMSCRVECSPLCSLIWLKDGTPINSDDDRYTINNTMWESDLVTNDFESVESTLTWHVSSWPGGQLDRVVDSANYTCQSTSNSAGPGVSSTTLFKVEYPPEKMEISETELTLVEGDPSQDGRILCTADALPEAEFKWVKLDEEDEPRDEEEEADRSVNDGNVLFFDGGARRDQAGSYECVAFNKHGRDVRSVKVDVHFAPSCLIEQEEDDGETLLLRCVAEANPVEGLAFVWTRNDNETLEGESDGEHVSLLRLPVGDSAALGNYQCRADNQVGEGVPCTLDVRGFGLVQMNQANVVLIVAVVAAVLLVAIIICVVLFLICRNCKGGKQPKKSDKYNNHHQDLAEREKKPRGASTDGHDSSPDDDAASSNNNDDDPSPLPDAERHDSAEPQQPPPTAAAPSDPAPPASSDAAPPQQHKWPLRPGVHVHLNGLHASGSGNGSGKSGAAATTARPPAPSSTDSASSASSSTTATTTASSAPRGPALPSDGAVQDHAAPPPPSAPSQTVQGHPLLVDTQQQQQHPPPPTHPRFANKTAAPKTLPKPQKMTPTVAETIGKLRGRHPINNSGNGNKSSPDSGFPGDAANQPDGKFYENLPFHGMQQQGNGQKQLLSPDPRLCDPAMVSSPPLPLPSPPPAPPPPNSLATNFTQPPSHANGSRPSSQLSQNGSSGYGSTAAHDAHAGAASSSGKEDGGSSSATPSNKSPTSCSGESDHEVPINKKRSVTWDGSVKGGFDHRPPSLRLGQRPPRLAELSEEDPGLDLIEAEVDSGDDEGTGPKPAPRQTAKANPCYMNMGDAEMDVVPPPPVDPTAAYGITLPSSHHPLRATQSTETMQVMTALPYNYHQSLPRHLSRGGGTMGSGGYVRQYPEHHSNNPDVQLYNQQYQQQQQQYRPSIGNGYHHPNSRYLQNQQQQQQLHSALPTVSATLNDFPTRTRLPHLQQQQQQTPQLRGHPQHPGARPAMHTTTLGGRGGYSQLNQQPKQFDSYYYHPATLARNGGHANSSSNFVTNDLSSSSGVQTNTSQSSSSSSTMNGVGGGTAGLNTSSSRQPLLKAKNRPNKRIVYADLALEQERAANGASSGGQQDPASTEYAVLKFKTESQIGKEIDV